MFGDRTIGTAGVSTGPARNAIPYNVGTESPQATEGGTGIPGKPARYRSKPRTRPRSRIFLHRPLYRLGLPESSEYPIMNTPLGAYVIKMALMDGEAICALSYGTLCRKMNHGHLY